NFPTMRVARNLFWRFGLRPLAGAAVDALAPHWYADWRKSNVVRSTPTWIATDPELRREMNDRAPAQLRNPRPRSGLYEQDMHASLDCPLAAMEYEEHFDFGRAMRMPLLHPYLDPDLIALLYRTPPALLASGGRTKALVRTMTANRFPQLGFTTQRKVDA